MPNETDKEEEEMEQINTSKSNRKERRKMTKKEKRKKKRQEIAEMERQLEESRLNDPIELERVLLEEELEKERVEKERKEFEEREKKILEEWERKRVAEFEEEETRRKARQVDQELIPNHHKPGYENESDEDGWEYVEEGPPEIIWQGNEIIVKKKKVRVKKTDQKIPKEDPNRPTSNPLPPQSEAFASHKSGYNPSAQQLLENVANQTPNFGTEQDKAHCPFHLKTGTCRFGTHCSRIHFYPDKSCTLLMKNMYNGPGLAWEQDEGLEADVYESITFMQLQPENKKNYNGSSFSGCSKSPASRCYFIRLGFRKPGSCVIYHTWQTESYTDEYTDEEVERVYEEFYEDVHTEFLKFGEIVNFKVCRNGSSHLRGNLYVHFKSLDSAVLAYEAINGRYFAGKQVQCEFVSVTKWRVAICGEFMRSKIKTCSRGTACNFIHCFRNPGGDYEWADWDKPPPRYWVQNMVALFGYSDDPAYDKHVERESPRSDRKSARTPANDTDRCHFQRSQSRDTEYARSSRNHSDDDSRSSYRSRHHRHADRKHADVLAVIHRDKRSSSRAKQHRDNTSSTVPVRNSSEWDKTTDSPRKRSGAHSNRRMDLESIPAEINIHNANAGTFGNGRQHREISKSPDDTDSCIYEEKYLRTQDFEEIKDEKSKLNRSNRDGDGDGDAGYASRDRRYSRSYSSRSRKDSGKSEDEDSRRKEKSKRKREVEIESDSDSRIHYRGKKERLLEVDEDRGRWEPD